MNEGYSSNSNIFLINNINHRCNKAYKNKVLQFHLFTKLTNQFTIYILANIYLPEHSIEYWLIEILLVQKNVDFKRKRNRARKINPNKIIKLPRVYLPSTIIG